jgi:hypothetical protein
LILEIILILEIHVNTESGLITKSIFMPKSILIPSLPIIDADVLARGRRAGHTWIQSNSGLLLSLGARPALAGGGRGVRAARRWARREASAAEPPGAKSVLIPKSIFARNQS